MDRTSNIVCKLLVSTADGEQERDDSLQSKVAPEVVELIYRRTRPGCFAE